MAKTTNGNKEPLFLGPAHRNCGYCGKTFFMTLGEFLIHLNKCEVERE